MNLTKKEIKELNATQLCARVTRLHFDEEAGCAFPGDKEEIKLIEKELRKKLVTMLGRDFYPPERPTIEKLLRAHTTIERKESAPRPLTPPQDEVKTPRLRQIKLKLEPGNKIKLKIMIFSSIGSKAAEFNVEVDSKAEADILARKEIRKLGLTGATYKIS